MFPFYNILEARWTKSGVSRVPMPSLWSGPCLMLRNTCDAPQCSPPLPREACRHCPMMFLNSPQCSMPQNTPQHPMKLPALRCSGMLAATTWCSVKLHDSATLHAHLHCPMMLREAFSPTTLHAACRPVKLHDTCLCSPDPGRPLPRNAYLHQPPMLAAGCSLPTAAQ